MSNTVSLSIAGIGIVLQSDHEVLMKRLEERFRAFCCSQVPVSHHVFLTHHGPFSEVDDITVTKRDDTYIITCDNAKAHTDFACKNVWVDIYPEASHINTFLRILFSCIH